MTRCVILALVLASSALAQTGPGGIDPPDRVFAPGPPLTTPASRLIHPRPVRGAAWAPDGSLIVSVCGDGTVRVWDGGNGRLRAAWDEAGAEFDCVAVSPGGTRVAAGTRDGRLQVREIRDGKLAADLRVSGDGLVSAAFAGGETRVATTDARGVLRIHDFLEPAAPTRILTDLGTPGSAVRCVGGATRFLTSAATARVWDLLGSEPAADLAALDPGSDADVSADGRWVVCIRPDFAIARVPVEGGESRDPLELPASSRPVRLRCAPDGDMVVALARDGSVWLCVPALDFKWKMAAADPGSRVLELSPDGQRIVVCGSPAQLAVYERKTAARLLPPSETDRAVTHMSFAPDGRTLYIARADGDVEALDPLTGARLRAWAGPDYRILALEACTDGRVLVATHTSLGVRVRDITTGADLVRYPQPAEPDFACLAGDAGVFVCDTDDQRIRVWDLATGLERRSVAYPQEWPGKDSRPADIVAAVLSADGEFLVGGIGSCYGFWSVRSGGQLYLSKRFEFDSAIALSPDGSLVATCRSFEGLCASPADRPGLRLGLNDRTGSPTQICMSADPRRAAGIRNSGTIFEWNPVTGSVPRQFEGVPSAVIAFSPDASRLVAGLPDGSIRLWHLHPHEPPRRTRNSLAELWGDLASARLDRSIQAAEELAAAGDSAVAFLREQLAIAPRAESVRRLIADLGSTAPAPREEARAELEWLGVLAEPELRRALKGNLSEELKAEVAGLLELAESRLSPSRTNRQRRNALHALEFSGLDSALQVILRTALDSPSPRERADANAAIHRLRARAAGGGK
ncbi:MAG: WD40 repeat domain-containing protein [Planctomycetes bacterium]|nr:WD40 repeat domain-containing protein [Planctomycetota bacterium]